jgi:CubicO group peptidase (beta-lactamase class C family)
MHVKSIVRTLAALPLLAALISCGDSPTGAVERLSVPPRTGDGWETGSLASVGMAEEPLEELLELVDATPEHRIHGFVLVRNGRLVLEAYWPGTDLEPSTLDPVHRNFDRETPHYVASVSKSLTSVLAGIARDDGGIGSVSDGIFDYFPDHRDLLDEENAPVTLRHLLSFTSGYEWNEFVYGFGDPRDSHYRMFRASDPIRHLLGRDVETVPGAVFHYNSGDTNLLGEVVRRVTGSETLVDFARERLFEPLEIDDFTWLRFGSAPHVTFASGGASLRPRDMAKLGVLYLDEGRWNGRQVVSAGWVAESVAEAIGFQTQYRSLYGYGYNWWLGRSRFRDGTVEYFRAAGWGGQDVFAFPELDLVVVFTAGGFYEARPLSPYDLLEDYILPAVVN